MASNDNPPPPLMIVSYNTHGLNSPIKCCKNFQNYHSQEIDVILLQETHFQGTYNPNFIHSKYPNLFLANAKDKMRGVAIFFSHRHKFILSSKHRDPEGRFLLIKGVLGDQLHSFVSCYAPNQG